jgi:hypothetical protein
LAAIINRRLAPALGPGPPRGPGARLDSITWVGWLFALGGFAWLVYSLQPLLQLGGIATWDWAVVGDLVLRSLRDAAIAAMPFALELGVPGARRRTPWLMRGLVLLALDQLSKPVLGYAREFAFTELDPGGNPFLYDTPLALSLGLLTLATNLLTIGGAWGLSDGLADAGSRPRPRLVTSVVILGTAISLIAYLPVSGFLGEGAVPGDQPVFWFNLAGLLMGLVEIALWFAVGTRLAAGPTFRLRPRRAWFLGAAAGAMILLARFAYPLLFVTRMQSPEPALALGVGTAVGWIVLFVAFAAGLGRGRERRELRPRRLRLYVLNPAD